MSTACHTIYLDLIVQTLSCIWHVPHGLQHTRLPCPSLSPGVCSNSCPLNRWYHLILCHPDLLLPTVFLSICVFSNELALFLRWPKYWSFSISPSNEYSGLIFFRIDWFDLLAVQGILKSLFQHHSKKASSILRCSVFFIFQLSHQYMTTRKTIALSICTFVSKVMSFIFNTLSRFIIASLPRTRRLNFMAAVTICSDFGAQENKVCHCFHCFPILLAMKWWDRMLWS